MAEGKNNLIGRILFPPCIVFAGIVALWENEGRFNYAQEASDATVIASPAEALPDTTISITGKLDTEIPIAGEYISINLWVTTSFRVAPRSMLGIDMKIMKAG